MFGKAIKTKTLIAGASAIFVTGTGAAAVSGALPGPLQQAMSLTASAVGVTIPSSVDSTTTTASLGGSVPTTAGASGTTSTTVASSTSTSTSTIAPASTSTTLGTGGSTSTTGASGGTSTTSTTLGTTAPTSTTVVTLTGPLSGGCSTSASTTTTSTSTVIASEGDDHSGECEAVEHTPTTLPKSEDAGGQEASELPPTAIGSTSTSTPLTTAVKSSQDN
ncbi:MAG: hypothetical protein M0T78_09020 [Actinomycetota bacterium]|nr:hypothetical protein [Actinomycetota bacterium]